MGGVTREKKKLTLFYGYLSVFVRGFVRPYDA